MMSDGFDALITGIKARFGKLIGAIRPGDGATPESAGSHAAPTPTGPPRHPLGSFRESVGQPTANERAHAASESKRPQDRGN